MASKLLGAGKFARSRAGLSPGRAFPGASKKEKRRIADMKKAAKKQKQQKAKVAIDLCSRRTLAAFNEGQLDADTKLEFLMHLDNCQRCWDEVYNLRKTKNAKFYKKSSAPRVIAEIEAEESNVEDEVFDVA